MKELYIVSVHWEYLFMNILYSLYFFNTFLIVYIYDYWLLQNFFFLLLNILNVRENLQ